MNTQTPTPSAQHHNPLSDEYVNALIQQHGYQSPEVVIARLYQWIGQCGGENSETLLMYEAHEELRKLHAVLADRQKRGGDEIGPHDLSTSGGGRGYLSEYFQKRLRRHDFTSYINGKLAADFACVLSRWLIDSEPQKRGGDGDGWKDHNERELVDTLRYIAINYHGAQQLRERIAHVIRPLTDKLRASLAASKPMNEGLQAVAFVQHDPSGARRAVLCREGMELPDDTTLYATLSKQQDKQQ